MDLEDRIHHQHRETVAGMNVDELVKRCQDGDQLAWEVLVRTYQSRVYGIAYSYAGDRDEARDLAQDTFIRVYRRIKSCREPERFTTWLIQVTRHVCIDHLRHRKARPAIHDLPVDDLRDLSSTEADPETDLEILKKKQLVYQGLRKLSTLNRDVIVLKELQGLKITEIAEIMKVPAGTIKSRLNRARIELARILTGLMGESNQGMLS